MRFSCCETCVSDEAANLLPIVLDTFMKRAAEHLPLTFFAINFHFLTHLMEQIHANPDKHFNTAEQTE